MILILPNKTWTIHHGQKMKSHKSKSANDLYNNKLPVDRLGLFSHPGGRLDILINQWNQLIRSRLLKDLILLLLAKLLLLSIFCVWVLMSVCLCLSVSFLSLTLWDFNFYLCIEYRLVILSLCRYVSRSRVKY